MLRYLDLQPGHVVLDAGCGDGLYSRIIALTCRPHFIHAIDADINMVERALENTVSGCCPHVMDIQNIQFRKEEFDRILCTEVLEHVPDPSCALSELYRVLKPGGILAVTVPNAEYPALWDPISWTLERLGIRPRSGIWNMHLRLYRYEEIVSQCEEAGFEIVKAEPLTHYCIPFSMQILRWGALIHRRIHVPGATRGSGPPGRWNLLRWVLRLFEAADRSNETRPVGFGSSVNIALKLRKPF